MKKQIKKQVKLSKRSKIKVMDYLIDWQEYKTKFNGDKVTMELLPLGNEGMIKIMPFLSIGNEADSMEATKRMFECCKVAADIFPDHVRNIKGFTIGGKEPDGEQLSKRPIFSSFVADIIGQLSKISTLTPEEIKNSAGRSGETVQENSTTA